MNIDRVLLDTEKDEELGSISHAMDDSRRCVTLYRHRYGLNYYHICRWEEDGPIQEFLVQTDDEDAKLFLFEVKLSLGSSQCRASCREMGIYRRPTSSL